jgi:iron complex outermembrane receptor protein
MRHVVSVSLIVTTAVIGSMTAVADTPPADQSGGGLAEIVVTAQKRSENIQNVPVSVDAVSALTLANAHITNLGQLSAIAPSLTISQTADVLNIFMRGIGNPATNIGQESSVAVYVDGVYYPRLPPALLELNNVDHIEVLKGPQGTLFGRNATGGLIQIITKDPSSEPTLHVDAGYGNFQTFTGNVYASTGIGDNLAGDIALHDTHMGSGWGTNLYNGTSYGYLESKAMRTKWVYKPFDGTKITLSYDYSDSVTTQSLLDGLQAPGYTHGAPCGATCIPFTPPNNVPYPYLGFYNKDEDFESLGQDIGQGGSLRVDQELPFARFVSTSALRHEIGSWYDDADYSPQDFFNGILPASVQSYSEELQLISTTASRFDWNVGLYYIHMRSVAAPARLLGSEFQNAFMLPDGQEDIYGSQTVDSYAAYTQETFHVTSDTNLTVGLRYTEDKVRATGHNDIADPPLGIDINTGTQYGAEDFNKVTYRFAIDHHFTDDLMAYASYNTGFQGGTFNIFPFSNAPNPPAPAVKPEEVNAYELGAKSDLMDHRVRLSTALFYNKVENLQVQIVRPVGNPPAATVLLSNAAEAKAKGIDLDLQAQITEQFDAHLSSTLQNPFYASYPNAGGSVVNPDGIGTLLTVHDATGQQLVFSPKYAVNVGVGYRLPLAIGEGSAGADYTYTSGYPLTPDQEIRNGGLGLLNARLGFTPPDAWKRWKFQIWGKNLTDKQYFSGAAEQNNRGGQTVAPAAPRTYGFTVSYDM